MQKRFMVSLLAFLALAVIFQSPINAETGRVTLKEQYKAGQSFKAVEQLNLEVQIGVAENSVKLKFATGMGYRYTVKQVAADGGMTVGLAIHALFSETPSVMGLNASFDSTDLFAVPQLSNLISASLVGQEVEVEIKPDGAVGNVKFSDAFMERVLRYAKNSKTPPTKEQLKTQAIQSLGGSLAKPENSLEQGIFPAKPVAVGDSWNKEIKIENNGFNISFQATYTLKQRVKGIAVIEIVAKVLGVSSQSGKATYECCNMDGWLKGTLTVIEACGWMRDFDLKFLIDGEIQPLKSADASAENSEADNEETAVSEADGAGETGEAAAEAEAQVAADDDGDSGEESEEAANTKFHIEASFSRKPGSE